VRFARFALRNAILFFAQNCGLNYTVSAFMCRRFAVALWMPQ
jgi:hypothetical protein